MHVELGYNEGRPVASRVGKHPVETDRHQQQPIKLLVKGGAAQHHHQDFAEAIDEATKRQRR
jgi:hypothetical protein